MPTWIRKLIQALAGKGEEEEEKEPGAEVKIAQQYINQIRAETLREAIQAQQYIKQYIRKTGDPIVKTMYETVAITDKLQELGYDDHIFIIALAKALQKGIKDPVEIAKYILAYHSVLHKQVRKIPYLEKALGDESLEDRGLLSPEAIPEIIYVTLQELEKRGLIKPGASRPFRVIHANADWYYQQWMLRVLEAEDLVKRRIEVSKKVGVDIEPYMKEIEKELGITEEQKPPTTTTGARELLRLAIAEQLPGWVIKAALDQAKIPLYTTAQGVHPSIIKYHIQRADPNHPQGTLLHGLITTLLAHWEREIAAGKQPTHPHQAIQQLTGPTPTEIDEETARRIAQALGLPTTITPQTLTQTLNELLRDLKQLKEGKDPHQLDAEKEAALRYNQLRELADNQTPHPYIKRIIREGRDQILNVYNELKNQILAETQLGREEQEKTLNIIENLLKTHLDTVLNTQKPLTQTIAEITKQATQTLKQEGIEDPQLRSWATNLLRNILLDAPIIAAARSPSTQYLPIEEKKKIAAALLQYYEREAREHKTAPVAADLHWMWQRIVEAGKNTEDPKKSMLETIERLRSKVNAVKALGRDAYSMYKPLLSAENFVKPPKPGEEGYLTHRVITDLYNIKKRLIEGTFPRIRRIREKP